MLLTTSGRGTTVREIYAEFTSWHKNILSVSWYCHLHRFFFFFPSWINLRLVCEELPYCKWNCMIILKWLMLPCCYGHWNKIHTSPSPVDQPIQWWIRSEGVAVAGTSPSHQHWHDPQAVIMDDFWCLHAIACKKQITCIYIHRRVTVYLSRDGTYSCSQSLQETPPSGLKVWEWRTPRANGG